MADRNRIGEFIELVEKKLYEYLPFSILEHVENDEQEYVMLKATSTYKGIMYRYCHIIDYCDITDVVHSLETLADCTAKLLYREFSNKFKEIQSEEGEDNE